MRVLRVEAEVFGVSRAGPQASLIERLIPFNAEYVEAAEGVRGLEDAGTDVGEDGSASESEATEAETEASETEEGEGATEIVELAPRVGAEVPTKSPTAATSREEAAELFESEWLATTRARGSVALAVRIVSQPVLREGAALAVKRRIFAPGTWRTHRSRVRTAFRLLQSAGVAPIFPLTLRALETLFGVLKAARYRSAAGYVSAMRVEAFLRGFPADPDLGEWCRRLARATARGRGDNKHSEPVTAEILERIVAVCEAEVAAAASPAAVEDALSRADAWVFSWT